MLNHKDLNELTRRYSMRKVNAIVDKTYAAFHKAIAEYGQLSAEEIFAIGINLFMVCCSQPLEKMSSDPSTMRKEVAGQLALMVERGQAEVN